LMLVLIVSHLYAREDVRRDGPTGASVGRAGQAWLNAMWLPESG